MDGGRKVRHAILLQSLGRQTGGGHGQVEHLGHGRADGAFILHFRAKHHVVRHDTRLPIGRPGQEVQPRFPGERMGKLDGVAHGKHVGRRGLQVLVHPNALRLAQFQSSRRGQGRLRPHPDGKDHHAGLNLQSRTEFHLQSRSGFLERLHGLSQIQPHTFLQQMAVHQGGHGVVQRTHHLIGHLHHGHLHPCVAQVLGHLQADETSAHHHGVLHPAVAQILLDAVGVGHVAQGENPRAVNALQRRPHGRSPWGEQQLVIRFRVGPPARGLHFHHFPRSVNGHHFGLRPHVDPETLSERLWRLNKQSVALAYHATYIIR